MPRALIEPRLGTNKQKLKIKPEMNNTKSTLPPNLQIIKQKLLSGSDFAEYHHYFLYIINEL